ncbi:MAG: prepilin-type N-terminal cleavage/methylation domain-containing protein, partial [Synergistota bacterium]|nr:prepilin-type N-terminal cleavage/methylation domain-containing protein [Synergistota bacterium]
GNNMKRFLKKRKARGFTLVELLIVIVIIGILAGSLLLVMGSGTDKANATKIVSNMRTLKAATLMYYADNDSWTGVETSGNLDTYLDRSIGSIYSITNDATNGIDVFANVTSEDTGVKTRLTGMASDSGLYADAAESADYSGGNSVYMSVSTTN